MNYSSDFSNDRNSARDQIIKVAESAVHQALIELPEEYSQFLDNVGFVIEWWPSDSEMESIKAHPANTLLFGLYQGVSKPKRSSHYSSLPDKISIFAGPILVTSSSMKEFRVKIKDTVFHEIGHHFGLNDHQIRLAEYQRVKKIHD